MSTPEPELKIIRTNTHNGALHLIEAPGGWRIIRYTYTRRTGLGGATSVPLDLSDPRLGPLKPVPHVPDSIPLADTAIGQQTFATPDAAVAAFEDQRKAEAFPPLSDE